MVGIRLAIFYSYGNLLCCILDFFHHHLMRDNLLNCRLDNSSTYDYVRVANE